MNPVLLLVIVLVIRPGEHEQEQDHEYEIAAWLAHLDSSTLVPSQSSPTGTSELHLNE